MKEKSMSKEKKSTYQFNMDCDNCGGGMVNIPWSTTIEDFKATHNPICPDCGCLMKAKTREKLNALETVFGILNELTTEQMEVFEMLIKRR